MSTFATTYLKDLKARSPHQPKFQQAAYEIITSLAPLLDKQPHYQKWLSLLMEPERILQFRVVWYDDQNHLRVNRGFRIQFSSLLGPYKGGLRFHPTVDLDTIKFLALEQTFKNALTHLMLGSGKGGSDFDPKGKSDGEIRRFCEAFMLELSRFIGPHLDVPAGDIGVGSRELGHLYHMYKKLKGGHECGLTGRPYVLGGSLLRPEATGYGLIYLVAEEIAAQGSTLEGKKIALSGSGNVAQYAAAKLLERKARVLTMSDSRGALHFPDGLRPEDLQAIQALKAQRGALESLPRRQGVQYYPARRVWDLADHIDIALPCATENELERADARHLTARGCQLVAEGANMPSTAEAIAHFHTHKIGYLCAKAANAGGVAVSGLEMAQSAAKYQWTATEVDAKLLHTMQLIYQEATTQATTHNVPFCDGANIAAFLRLADAIAASGYGKE